MPAKTDKSIHLNTVDLATRKRVHRAIRALQSGEYAVVSLTRKRWRASDAQRACYWGYLIVKVSQLIGKNSDQTDKVLNSLFLSEPWAIAGEVVTVVKSFSDLDPVAASIYFEHIAGWVGNKYGVKLNPPDEAKAKSKLTNQSRGSTTPYPFKPKGKLTD